MKKHITIPVTIGLLTTCFTLGGSWAIIKAKADAVDEVKKKADATEIKVATLDTKLDDMKEDLKEQKNDTKSILKLLMKNETR